MRGALGKAVEAFLMVLDEYSLADLNRDSDAVRALFIPAGKPQSSLDRSEQDPCP